MSIRTVNHIAFKNWASQWETIDVAIANLVTRSGVSISLASKLLKGKYPRVPSKVFRTVIAQALKTDEDELFPFVASNAA